MPERLETQAGQPADYSPEYSDVTPRMLEQATATSNLLNQKESEIRTERASSTKGMSQSSLRTAAYGQAYGPSAGEQAFYIVRGAEGTNQDINMAAHRRVSEMIGDAIMEDRAHNTVSRDGKIQTTGQPTREYVQGRSKTASNDKSVPGRLKWGAESVSTYSIDNDGKARKINQRPGAPQHMEPVTARHEFSPEHQKRAKELIQSLADKQGERAYTHEREDEVRRAQELIAKANAPKQELDKAA